MSRTGLSFVITALCATVLGIFAADAVRPALAADAFNGKRLAELWCAACHVATVNQRQANADPPPFDEIAKRPNFAEPGHVTLLPDPHPNIPTMNPPPISA